jgi:hypothetical protein
VKEMLPQNDGAPKFFVTKADKRRVDNRIYRRQERKRQKMTPLNEQDAEVLKTCPDYDTENEEIADSDNLSPEERKYRHGLRKLRRKNRAWEQFIRQLKDSKNSKIFVTPFLSFPFLFSMSLLWLIMKSLAFLSTKTEKQFPIFLSKIITAWNKRMYFFIISCRAKTFMIIFLSFY